MGFEYHLFEYLFQVSLYLLPHPPSTCHFLLLLPPFSSFLSLLLLRPFTFSSLFPFQPRCPLLPSSLLGPSLRSHSDLTISVLESLAGFQCDQLSICWWNRSSITVTILCSLQGLSETKPFIWLLAWPSSSLSHPPVHLISIINPGNLEPHEI